MTRQRMRVEPTVACQACGACVTGHGPVRAGRLARYAGRRLPMPSDPSPESLESPESGVGVAVGRGLAGAGVAVQRLAFIVGREALQQLPGRDEEQRAGDGRGEVEDAVGVAGRVSDEHVREHQLDQLGRPRVRDVVGAELLGADAAERHVEPHDLALLAVGTLDHVEREVGVRRLVLVGHLDVVEFRAPDRELLLFGRQRIPGA